jgi:predicted nucleic acid-binding protein
MIVFDTSTLILLTRAGLLDAFLDDYRGKVLIPREVEAESCGRKKSLDALLIAERIREHRIGVAKVANTRLCEQIMRDFNICGGEAEAIALAIEKKANLVATDDRNAIRACKLLKISFTSAIAILTRMAERKIIDTDRINAALDTLIKYGRYSDGIIREARERLEIEEERQCPTGQ